MCCPFFRLKIKLTTIILSYSSKTRPKREITFFFFSVVTPSISSIEVDEEEAADTNRLSSTSSVEKWGMRESSLKVPKNELNWLNINAWLGFWRLSFIVPNNLPSTLPRITPAVPFVYEYLPVNGVACPVCPG